MKTKKQKKYLIHVTSKNNTQNETPVLAKIKIVNREIKTLIVSKIEAESALRILQIEKRDLILANYLREQGYVMCISKK